MDINIESPCYKTLHNTTNCSYIFASAQLHLHVVKLLNCWIPHSLPHVIYLCKNLVFLFLVGCSGDDCSRLWTNEHQRLTTCHQQNNRLGYSEQKQTFGKLAWCKLEVKEGMLSLYTYIWMMFVWILYFWQLYSYNDVWKLQCLSILWNWILVIWYLWVGSFCWSNMFVLMDSPSFFL